MGNWKLEIVRMACYVSFPLTAMFLFSRPELFKDRVIEARKRYHPPPNPERDELIRQLKERERLRRESEVLEQMSQFQTDDRSCMDSGTTAVINYLELRTEVDRVLLKEKSKCSLDAFMRWEEKNSCELPEDLKRFYSMSDGLEIRWSIKTSSKNVVPTYLGKMYINPLNDLAQITTTGSKQMAVDELNDFAENDTPRFNSQSWQLFELDPCDGQGRICLVFNPTRETSIWYLDRSLHFHHLASTFTEYYRLLLLHCGLPYWHHKYTDSGIPPYILHWYYTILPSLYTTHAPDDSISASIIPFNPEKVFQRGANAQGKNTKASNLPTSSGMNPIAQATAGARSATQNQKRPTQQTKSINRSSSVPRSMNN